MTITDELRALAEWLDTCAALLEQVGVPYGSAAAQSRVKSAEVRALADRLQGKVAVRPTMRRYESNDVREPFIAELRRKHSAIGATEVEAIANLQATLDAAGRGDG